MEPSRELDILVAVALGWRQLSYRLWHDENGRERWIDDREGAWSPSTDIVAAFTVDKPGWLWEFKESRRVLSVALYTSRELRRLAIEMFPVLSKDVVTIWQEWLDDKAATYALARCLAALKAMGVEVEDA